MASTTAKINFDSFENNEKESPTQKTYDIYDGYQHRDHIAYFDDTGHGDEHQLEVYKIARHLADKFSCKNIIDIGCGSGFKLLQFFGHLDTIGVDLPPTISVLEERYSERKWLVSDFAEKPMDEVDLIICSDVIEHVLNPNDLLDYINKIDYKYVVISTPDRDLLRDTRPTYDRHEEGPPENPCHVREWNMPEFNKYISRHFDIVYHGITNAQQYCQAVVCIRKDDNKALAL